MDGCSFCAASTLLFITPKTLIAASYADDPDKNVRWSHTGRLVREAPIPPLVNSPHSLFLTLSTPPDPKLPTPALTGADVYKVNTGEQQADSARALASLVQLPRGRRSNIYESR